MIVSGPFQNHSWYKRPSIDETEGDVLVVTFRAEVVYQIRATFSEGAGIALVPRDPRHAIEIFGHIGVQSPYRTTAIQRFDIRSSREDREVEIWFGFTPGATDERFTNFVVEQVPEGGITMGKRPETLWRWPAPNEG